MKTIQLPIIVGALAFCLSVQAFNLNTPMIGADISFVPQEEARGKKYYDKGVEADVLSILRDNGFNWIRLRLFVDPTAEHGYFKEGFCGLEHTLTMAKRIKVAGLQFLLDFHYSDTWADPGKQYTPAAWQSLNAEELEVHLYRYTQDVLKRFIVEGVRPDMVQVGNEINHGMLWPIGKLEGKMEDEPFYGLLRRAAAAVRDVDPNIAILLHIACGGQYDQSVCFLDKVIQHRVDFDVIGQSYYPEWHGTPEDLAANLKALAERYAKPLLVVEYQVYRKEVNDIVHELPNGLGLGTFIWEATSPRWGNLFDQDGRTNENMLLYPQLRKAYVGQ